MKIPSKFPWLFIILALGINWIFLLPGILASRGFITLPFPIYALVAVGQFGPSLAAFILTYRQEGGAGAKRLFKRALNWRIPLVWLAVILLMPCMLTVLTLGIDFLTGASLPAFPMLAQPAALLFNFIFIFLMQGPLPEEFGWRGYLLRPFADPLERAGIQFALGWPVVALASSSCLDARRRPVQSSPAALSDLDPRL